MSGPASLLPLPAGSDGNIRSRSNPAGSVQRTVEQVDTGKDLNSRVQDKTDSTSYTVADTGPAAVTEENPLKLKLAPYKAASASDLRSGLASPVIPDNAVQSLISAIHSGNPGAKVLSEAELPRSTFFAGASRKPFVAHNHLLVEKVPYFRKLLSSKSAPTRDQLTFDDFDEYAAALFIRWLYVGVLHGPTEFHSMHNYLCLYVLAFTWDIEALCNHIMDLVRLYYHRQSMTAPAFRLEYIYTMTHLPNPMRRFLVQTAAFRALCESPLGKGVYLSESIKGILKKGGDVAIDFAEALVKLSRDEITDPRKGDNCRWHEHSDGKLCPARNPEPFA